VAGIYGPGRGHAFKQFLRGEAHLDGKGDRILNMIHRDDVVGAIIAALKYSDTGEIYNAADDEPVSQLEFFEWLAKSLNKPLPISISDSLRKRGATNRKISNRKLKSRLDYTFRFPTFREGYDTNLQ
jgi:nucleoside-diphosphate-sugar epimerase